ncbi:uncharacterized protein BKCO1_5600048 [Diplodia corticola]|uniref:Uncharacterized protein n=1 Tax=Diplodia corticola TaxID=236234 RepID=A0A1J9QQQ7_9PEZI|nr:uncharacterized protein BKCO1_5600048 [Diplodia corticola]OJD30784.1 hypothetical protein BKCO1_5600048 [Diplodia corticola]
MQNTKDTSTKPPHLTHSPPTPPPEKQQQQQHTHTHTHHEDAASDTYTEDDDYVVIEWEEDEAERAIDLANSADLSSSAADLAASASSLDDLSSSSELLMARSTGSQRSWHGIPYDRNPDQHKAHWYHDWLRDKKVERADPWGFSSTGVSRTASPARGATA